MEELPLLCSFCDHTHSWLSWMFTSDAFLLRPVPPYLRQLAEYYSLSAPLLCMPLQQEVSSTSTPQLPACFACLWVGWAWVSSDPKAIWPCSAAWANKADLWEGSFLGSGRTFAALWHFSLAPRQEGGGQVSICIPCNEPGLHFLLPSQKEDEL